MPGCVGWCTSLLCRMPAYIGSGYKHEQGSIIHGTSHIVVYVTGSEKKDHFYNFSMGLKHCQGYEVGTSQ